jgi:multiple sugar transport system ATP-binding protein
MAEVRYDGATRMYPGTDAPAVNALDLHIQEGEFVVLVGPSGSGKTTALRMLAGLEEVDAGTISIGDRDVTDLPPKQRDIAMVFQNYALYPYLSVESNIAFPLKIAKVPKPERAERVQQVAEMLGLTEYLHRKPGQLSGGQRQRVAMGRAMVRRPSVYLMDEPLSNLDAQLRVQMRSDIAGLQHELGVTTVYVTHDQSEAMTMGSRIVVMKGGVIQQTAPPLEIYRKPANRFVAGFIGSPSMNFLELEVAEGALVDSAAGIRIPLPDSRSAEAARADGPTVVLGVRPEHLQLVADGEGEQYTTVFQVEVVQHLGNEMLLDIVAGPHRAIARADAEARVRAGERRTFSIDMDRVHFFHPRTEVNLAIAG